MPQSKRNAGEHKKIRMLDRKVTVRMNPTRPYEAHLYECPRCGLTKTRRELRKTPCQEPKAG